jgi:hypothetical protein
MPARAAESGPGLMNLGREGQVSYSMLEPEGEPVCECRYDEVHDRMDREDGCLHCDMEEKVALPGNNQTTLKKPAAAARRNEESAA